MNRNCSKLIMLVVAVGILMSMAMPSFAASYEYVDVPVYEPTGDNVGYVWFASDEAWVLAIFELTYNTTDDGPTNLERPILPIRLGVGLGWNPISSSSDSTRVFFTDFLSNTNNTTDTGLYDSFIVTLTIIGSNHPLRSYVYRRSDPGIAPVEQLTNKLGNVDSWDDFSFLYAGNIGDFRIYLNNGTSRSNFTSSYFYNNIRLPRFLGQHVSIEGSIQIESTPEQNNAISDVADRLDMAADKLENLASQMQVSRPQLGAIGLSTPIDIGFRDNVALASLGTILNIDLVKTLLISSLGMAILFVILRGTLE